jgi:multiple sugar transport system permease protein
MPRPSPSSINTPSSASQVESQPMQATMDRAKAARVKTRSIFDSERFLGSVLLLPAVVYITLLVGIPFVLAIAFSFTDVTTGNTALTFVGLDTFKRVVQDTNFQHALVNTIGFTFISQAVILVLANILAPALTQKFRGKWIVRFLILLPWATPVALATLGWWWMLHAVYNPFNFMLRGLGIIGPNDQMVWLGPQRLVGIFLPGPNGQPQWWGLNLSGLMVILVHVWRMLPMSTVIIMAGLTSIPPEIKDAATVDGTNFLQEFWYVTMPLLRPITAVAFLFGVIFTFTDMAVVRVLTTGNNDTHVLASWAFFKGIEGGNLSEGAATAVFLLPVLIGVAVMMLRIARRAEVT